MVRIRRISFTIAVAAVAALGSHSALSTAAGTRTISVRDDYFSARKVTVSKNTLVTWRWSSSNSRPHDVVSRGAKRFTSSKIKDSGTHRYRFKKAGTYKYVCTLHEDRGMTGQIVVR